MRNLRKVHDEREARSMLAKVEAAGGDVGAWARAHNIDGRSLHAWSRNLARRGTGAGSKSRDALGLVEIVSTPTPVRGRYVLRLRGAELELDDDFREETLLRILAVLRSC